MKHTDYFRAKPLLIPVFHYYFSVFFLCHNEINNSTQGSNSSLELWEIIVNVFSFFFLDVIRETIKKNLKMCVTLGRYLMH